MPKLTKDLPSRLDFWTTDKMRLELIALAYMMGAGGQYAVPARNLLGAALREKLAGMSEAERKEFDEILENVRIREGVL